MSADKFLALPKALQKMVLRHIDAGNLTEVLTQGEASELVLRNGRRLGQQSNRERAQEHRRRWREKAAAIKVDRPYLTPEKLAMEVCDWCAQAGIRFRNGKAYSFRTILDDLKAQIPIATLHGNGAAAERS